MDELREIRCQFIVSLDPDSYSISLERQTERMIRDMLWTAWKAGYYLDEIETEETLVGFDQQPWQGWQSRAPYVQIIKKALAKKRPTDGEG